MITKKGAEIYGYVTIALMMIILLLVWFRAVDQHLFVPLLIVAIILFISRVAVRIIATRKAKQEEAENNSPE